MARLTEVDKDILKERGAPYLDRLRKVDKGGNNWNECRSCGEWVQGICKPCQSVGKLVRPLGQGAFAGLL